MLCDWTRWMKFLVVILFIECVTVSRTILISPIPSPSPPLPATQTWRQGGSARRGACCCCWNKMAVRAGGAAEESWGNAEEEEEGGRGIHSCVCVVLPKEQQLRRARDERFWDNAHVLPLPIVFFFFVVTGRQPDQTHHWASRRALSRGQPGTLTPLSEMSLLCVGGKRWNWWNPFYARCWSSMTCSRFTGSSSVAEDAGLSASEETPQPEQRRRVCAE